MKIVILCGGQGTRLREETEFRPKPLVEIGGKPILWHIMKVYAHYGFNQFVLCLGYRGNLIKEYFLNYEPMNNDFTICLGSGGRVTFNGAHREQNFSVTLVDTGQEALTGSRICRVKKYVGDDDFMVTYGDGVADVNIAALARFHRDHGRVATVAAYRPISRFGILDADTSGKVIGFTEKPCLEGLISIGFFVFTPQIFDYLDDSGDCALEREPLESLAREGQLMAYRHNGCFFPMDTYRDYLQLNKLWSANQAPWHIWD